MMYWNWFDAFNFYRRKRGSEGRSLQIVRFERCGWFWPIGFRHRNLRLRVKLPPFVWKCKFGPRQRSLHTRDYFILPGLIAEPFAPPVPYVRVERTFFVQTRVPKLGKKILVPKYIKFMFFG